MEILTSQNDFVLPEPTGSGEIVDSGPDSRWQEHLKLAIRSLAELLERLKLQDRNQAAEKSGPIQAIEQFPVFVPLPFFQRMEPGNWDDPLLKQVLPVAAEDELAPGYSLDPLQEMAAMQQPGLLHKYQGRVLLVTTGACAIHCRYCFRRHFPYQDSPKSREQWSEAIEQIAGDESIEEVILSGGDPLMLVDPTLRSLLHRLEQIPHLQRLRLHTRLPIMIPQRVTVELLEMLRSTRMRCVMVIHSNHPHEIDDAVAQSLARLSQAGVTLLNQSVLLRGINDDRLTLIRLSQRLFECGVLPYYLHKNDPVVGTAHFEVSTEQGLQLLESMRAALPGYLVPRFVQEIAGERAKVVLG